MSAPITATELAEMEVDAARGDLKAFDGIRLLAEVRRLRAEVEGYERWATALIKGYVALGAAVGQRPGNRPVNG